MGGEGCPPKKGGVLPRKHLQTSIGQKRCYSCHKHIPGVPLLRAAGGAVFAAWVNPARLYKASTRYQKGIPVQNCMDQGHEIELNLRSSLFIHLLVL